MNQKRPFSVGDRVWYHDRRMNLWRPVEIVSIDSQDTPSFGIRFLDLESATGTDVYRNTVAERLSFDAPTKETSRRADVSSHPIPQCPRESGGATSGGAPRGRRPFVQVREFAYFFTKKNIHN